MNLSKRLSAIASVVPSCQVMADIGTDHGYLPIELVKKGIASKAYAMDINKGPLKKAEENIVRAKEEGSITTILSDGLANLPDDVQVVVIAGMGGMLVKRILEINEDKVKRLDEMVLSPHQDIESVRRCVHQLGFGITGETMVEDQGKFYTIISCKNNIEETYTDLEYKYGSILIKEKPKDWVHNLLAIKDAKEKVIEKLVDNNSAMLEKRIQEIQSEIKEIEKVMRDEII